MICRSSRIAALILGFAMAGGAVWRCPNAWAVDESLTPALQYFEGTYQNLYDRVADVFAAGYGVMWLPPPGRASTGNSSVGYDPRDRFDLGQWNDKTLHGTETGLRAVAAKFERAGKAVLVDLIWNHNGYQYDNTPGFMEAGGYPGMVLQNPDGGTDPFGVPNTNGDFHSVFASGHDARFNNLIDINHSSNHQLIRNPVAAGDSRNIPAGTGSWFGETYNVPDPSNARFYPDRDLQPIMVFNPGTGQGNIAIYPYNQANPLAGDAVPENGLGYLMRNVRWLVEDVGVEGFRLDIPWHFPEWVMDYFDQAVYRASRRRNLDGSQYNAFSFMEAGRGQQSELIRRFVRKTINPNDIGRIGSNYDALDFEFFHNLVGNLTNNGFQNDWRNVVFKSLDYHDDGLMNGSAGIKFAQSHDDTPAYLNSTAHAYMLMMPGRANVYFNAKQHGQERDFPRNGRGDALGGVYGDKFLKLLDIRNTHGRGNYRERWLEKETYIFERGNAALVGLSNRLDSGYTERRVTVDFKWGATLVELTGNSVGFSNIPDLITVDDDFFEGPRKATIRVPHNGSGDKGYVIYGLATPQSQQGIVVTQSGNAVPVIAGGVPANNDFSNGATRLTDLHVITGNTFTLGLETQAVTLTGRRLENGQLVNRSIRDRDADGDAALFRFDGGIDLNGINPFNTVSGVDFDSGSVFYGFEEFTTVRQPGYDAANGNGNYEQAIDASLLGEGEHYVTVRVFRRRTDGGPAVFKDFRRVIYVDRLPPVSAVGEIRAVNAPGSGDRDILIESTDFTANGVHVFANLPATVTDAEILAMAQAGQGLGERVDISLFKKYFPAMASGNNVLTVVSFEITGNSNVQRIAGLGINNARGAGLGDLNHDGSFTAGDITGPGSFEQVLYSQNTMFDPAADINADGLVDNHDLFALKDELLLASVGQPVLDAQRQVLLRRGDFNNSGTTDDADLQALYDNFGTSSWLFDLNVDGIVGSADIATLLTKILSPTPGDFNLDGYVDSTDYVLWRKNGGTPEEYNSWRTHFGRPVSAEAGMGVSLQNAVPEPTCAWLLTLNVAVMSLRRVTSRAPSKLYHRREW